MVIGRGKVIHPLYRDPSLVPEILKIEGVNFVDADVKKPFRQLFGYAISAKRYALYGKSANEIHMEKVSSVPTLFCLGIQPNRLNVHARSSVLPQEVAASFRHTKQ
jgi:hypothetical protein